jgi:hypothetical protein
VLLEVGQPHPGLGPDDQVAGGVLQHLVQRPGLHHQVEPLGRVAQPELAAPTGEGHGQSLVGGGPEHLAGLFDRAGHGHEPGCHPIDPVATVGRPDHQAVARQVLDAHG